MKGLDISHLPLELLQNYCVGTYIDPEEEISQVYSEKLKFCESFVVSYYFTSIHLSKKKKIDFVLEEKCILLKIFDYLRNYESVFVYNFIINTNIENEMT